MNQTQVSRIVAKAIADVRKKGDAALIQYARKFDKAKLTPKTMRVSEKQVKAGYDALDLPTRKALESCARRIQEFHWQETKNLPKSWTVNQDGVRLGQIFKPIQSVGVYVPGGRFSYPSTLLMTAIPARLAGVERRVVVTPAGKLTNEILAAAHIAHITDLFQVGGPSAVAGLALGTKTLSKVDLIIGPGNALVTEAKRQLFGEVGIDLLAGPSELAVIADETAPPAFVAADMAAQAEHDPDAKSFLVTTHKPLVAAVKKALPSKIKSRCKLIYEKNVDKAIEIANEIAAEHVEVMVRRPSAIMDKLRNGGAFFLNPWSTAVMGDYWAGPSHVLPTGKSARFASGLSVLSFIKRSSLIEITESAFMKGAPQAKKVAESEGLVEHARSLAVRLGEE